MEKKIDENWKAIEDAELKVREKTGDPEAGFNASTWWFSNDGRHLMLPVMYRTKKGENFSKSYKEMMIYANFCPFTGKPLYETKVEEVVIDGK